VFLLLEAPGMCGCCRGGACPGSPSAKGTVLTGRGGSLAAKPPAVLELLVVAVLVLEEAVVTSELLKRKASPELCKLEGGEHACRGGV